MTWTIEREGQLRALVTCGFSFSEIARKIPGVTRNAAIGKAHRLGLQGPAKPSKKGVRRSTIPKSRKRKPPSLGVSGPPPARRGGLPPTPKPSPVHSSDLIGPIYRPDILTIHDGMCRYLFDGGHFCGKKTCGRGHGAWCAWHADIVYQPRQIRIKPDTARPFAPANSSELA